MQNNQTKIIINDKEYSQWIIRREVIDPIQRQVNYLVKDKTLNN